MSDTIMPIKITFPIGCTFDLKEELSKEGIRFKDHSLDKDEQLEVIKIENISKEKLKEILRDLAHYQ